MTDDRVDFASMLASRLCHDLLSPVGAFANGLELLADEKDPAMRERCFELLEQSARTSANKLKFFRLAFGSAGGFGELVPADEAKSAIQGIIGDRAIDLNWMIGTDPLPKPAVKIILNPVARFWSMRWYAAGGSMSAVKNRARPSRSRCMSRPSASSSTATSNTILTDGEGASQMTSRTAPAVLVQAVARPERRDRHAGTRNARLHCLSEPFSAAASKVSLNHSPPWWSLSFWGAPGRRWTIC